MIDLSKQVGFEVYLQDDGYLSFGNDVLFNEPKARLFSQSRDFFRDSKAQIKNDILYLMYRDVRKKNDVKLLIANGLRYDLTVIYPGTIGNEFNKTIGHFHPFKDNTKVSYPEIYEVILGQAVMLLQKYNLLTNSLEAFYYIQANVGDKIIIPCQENIAFGHTTINKTKNFLVLANTQERTFTSDYSKYLNNKGAAYYLINKDEQILFEKNLNYKNHPEIVKLIPRKNLPQLYLSKENPLYLSLIKNIKTFHQYLTFPQKSIKILSIDNVYQGF